MRLAFLIVAALAACQTKSPAAADRTGSGSGSALAGSSASAVGGADTEGHNATGTRPHQGANCPSSLVGATTQIAMTPRGVDVTVTAKDPATAARITALGELHVRGRTGEKPRPHDQQHGGAGSAGYCPVLANDQTRVTMTRLPDGATLHVDARSPERVPELQALIKARAVRLPGYVSS
jgi:hypothetical protein